MPRFPSPKKSVERSRVGTVVGMMLRNPEVGDVDCMEQTDHKFTVNPRPRIPKPVALTPAPPRRKKKAKNGRTARKASKATT